MQVLRVWPDAEFLHGEWGRRRVTSYWVRVTGDELPRVLARSSEPDRLSAAIASATSEDDAVFLLVSADLDSIVALPRDYPESGQWNGMSPFQDIAPWRIEDLDELAAGPRPGS